MLLHFVKDALRAQQQGVTIFDCVRHFAVKVSECLDWLSSHVAPVGLRPPRYATRVMT
jgi:hypothetical protein